MALFSKFLNSGNEREIKAFRPIVEKINALESDFIKLSDQELRATTDNFRARLKAGETHDDILPEAFAAVREAAKRTLGQRHFDVQLIGGMVLHSGGGAEMRTGEGKTLVATLPAYLNALEGHGVHVVTVNDYLSRRDTVWMGQIYHALGLSVGVINHSSSFLYDPSHKELDAERDATASFHVVHEFLRPVSRKEAYAADITYGTNNEFGFDYLRDNIEYDPSRLAQRGYNYAIVDEVDSILIDEARTPLIISAPTSASEDLYGRFATIAGGMKEGEHYTIDEKLHAITITDEGINYAEKALGVGNIYTEKGIKYVHHLESAVKAKALYLRDRNYVVKDRQVVIVDEFTGRLQPGRRWSEGLHQAIEAKEGVPVEQETRTFASITFQNYFRLYKKLAGMTGTALTSKEEFYKVYGLNIVAIPTNRPAQRIDHNDLIFQTEHGKFLAVARKIKELHATGRPVLVGTVSIEKNELLSEYLKREGVQHELLNAKNHEKEGEIISQAGRRGAVTIATNMAGRGVDIKLGGALASKEERDAIESMGGLYVIGTERHEARRIDNQLRGRSGRQGDKGETQFFVSLEDTLMRVFASDTIKKLMGRIGLAEDEPIQNSMITRSLESAQTKIEGFNFDARKRVLQFDDVLNVQRAAVYGRRRTILTGSPEDIFAEVEAVIAGDEELGKVLAAKRAQFGHASLAESLRKAFLQTIDTLWVEHLEVMDYMRSSVNLRAYGQRDPLVEYRKEGLRLFREMQEAVNHQILTLIPHLTGENIIELGNTNLVETHESGSLIGGDANPAGNAGNSGVVSAASPKVAGGVAEVGRNDLCPCGSGKKYKKCHGVS